MEKIKDGSVLIFLLLIMTSAALIAITTFRSTIAFYELALSRMEHVRQQAAAEALALYGIAMVAEKDPWNIPTQTFAQWPPGKSNYGGTITVLPQEQKIVVTAQLVQEGNPLYSIESVIAAQKEQWRVINWNVDKNALA